MNESNGILIVEDEFLVALDLEDIVGNAGYRVVGNVADRQGALELESAPRLAFVDINLRDGPTGVEIARMLSERYDTLIVFVTANPDQIDAPPRSTLGYIQKPFTPELIEMTLAFAEGRSHVPRGLTRLS